MTGKKSLISSKNLLQWDQTPSNLLCAVLLISVALEQHILKDKT